MIERSVQLLFGSFQYNLHGLLNMAAGLFNLTVGLVVLLNNPKSPLHRSFFYFTASAFIWVSCYGFLSGTQDIDSATLWLCCGPHLSAHYLAVCDGRQQLQMEQHDGRAVYRHERCGLALDRQWFRCGWPGEQPPQQQRANLRA